LSSFLKRKRFLWALAVILIFTFSFTSLGLPYAYASQITAAPQMVDEVPPVNDTVNKPTPPGNVIIAGPSDIPAKPGKAKIEIPSRRSANSKMFLEPDGTFSVDIYPKSVFYKDNKLQWAPIESTLVPAGAGPFKAKNKANRFGVQFGDGSKVSIQKKDIALDFEPAAGTLSQGIVSGNKIKYSNVYPDVDIEYTSDNDLVKEDIILNTPDAPNTFTFELKTKNLTIGKDAKTGLLTLYDKKDNPVGYFMPAFMVDAENVVSDKVTLEYKKAGGKEQLVVTADAAWLKDPARRYPVKIDPTVYPDVVAKDTFVSNWYPSTQFSSYNFLSSGYDSASYGTTRSFIQYVLPSLPSSSSVTSASFSLYQYLTNTATTVDVHKITSGWTASGTTWNAQPGYSATAETSINSTATGYWTFLVSNLVKAWYDAATPNYGVAVKHRTETQAAKQFISSNGANNKPYMTVNYKVDPIGHEDQWGFTPDGVNGFNGNLLYQAADLNIPGRGIPVSFSRTYNSRSAKDSVFGYGWTANAGTSVKDSGFGPVILTDEDGTEHIFSRQPDGTFTAPNGVYLELVKDYTNNTYTVTRLDGVKIYFNSAGKITKITDTAKTPNTTTYNYDVSGKLTSISDASGRVTNFYYNAGGKLSQITDPAGRNIVYGYDADGNLTSVTDPAGKATAYSYDANHNLTGVTDPNGKTVSYGYDAVNDRVTSVSRTVTINGVPTAATTTLSYDTATNTTTRTDAKGNKTNFIYEPAGKITEIVQDPGVGGLNYSTKFSYDVDNNVTQITDPKNGTYTASYELGKGNLINETNPLAEQYQYSYDSRNNQNVASRAI